MPLHEYHCAGCGNHFDELIRMPEDEPSFCKYCASADIHRSLSAHGGYKINGNNSASSKPKRAASFKRGNGK